MEENGEAPTNYSYITGDLGALLENDDEFLPEAEINEAKVAEVMAELWKEIYSCHTDYYNIDINISPPRGTIPASMSSSSHFVVGRDNETCGSTFSDSASTEMAGVGMGPTKVLVDEEIRVPLVANGAGVVEDSECCMQQGGGPGGGGDGGEEMDGCDCGEVHDEWLDRILSMDAQEFQDWA